MKTREGNVKLGLALTALVVLQAAVGMTAAIEVALLSQSVQDADARGCRTHKHLMRHRADASAISSGRKANKLTNSFFQCQNINDILNASKRSSSEVASLSKTPSPFSTAVPRGSG